MTREQQSVLDKNERIRLNTSRMNQLQISREGQSLGEFDQEQIQEGLRSGYFQPTDWYWAEGMPEWRLLSDFVATTSPTATAPIAAVPVVRNPGPGAARPRLAANPVRQLTFNLATPWQRLVAALGDIIVPFLILFGLTYGLEVMGLTKTLNPIIVVGGFLLMWLVLNLSMLAFCAQTVGKKMAGIRIVNTGDGNPSGLVTILIMRNIVGRLLPSILPIYPLIDVCFIFSEQHRCLHDRIAGTVVVKV